MSVERTEWDGHLHEFFGPPLVSDVVRSGSLLELLEARPAELRQTRRHRLGLAVDGWRDEQGTSRRGKKPARILRIAPKTASSAVCSLKERVYLLDWLSTEPTATTSKWSKKRSTAFRSGSPSPRRRSRRTSAWTRGTTTTRSVTF